MSVAFLGPKGSYSHQAATEYFSAVPDHEFKEYPTIHAVLAASIQSGIHAVVPYENSTTGLVGQTLEFLTQYMLAEKAARLTIYDQHQISIRHCLLSFAEKGQIKTALSQCSIWLKQNLPLAQLVPVTSTSRAAELAASNHSSASVSSDMAAKLFNVPILERAIQNRKDNTTRWIVIGPGNMAKTELDVTLLLVHVHSLSVVLEVFANEGVRVRRIDARPSGVSVWDKVFMIECLGHVQDAAVKAAVNELKRSCRHLLDLGSFPVPKTESGL